MNFKFNLSFLILCIFQFLTVYVISIDSFWPFSSQINTLQTYDLCEGLPRCIPSVLKFLRMFLKLSELI